MKLFYALLGAFAALALVLAPTAAVAYTGGDEAVIVSDSNPQPGETFTVVVKADAGSSTVTLSIEALTGGAASSIFIDGKQVTSLTKAATGGSAEFSVRLDASGRYRLVGLDEAGNVVGESIVVVGDGGSSRSTNDDAAAGGGLPDTGAGAGTMLVGGAGALLLAVGAGAMLFSRRRPVQQVA